MQKIKPGCSSIASQNHCEWCQSEQKDSFLKCHNCRMWRKDIYIGRSQTYSFMALWLIHFFAGLYLNYWTIEANFLDFTLQMMTSVSGCINFTLLGLFWFFYFKTSQKIGTMWWF